MNESALIKDHNEFTKLGMYCCLYPCKQWSHKFGCKKLWEVV